MISRSPRPHSPPPPPLFLFFLFVFLAGAPSVVVFVSGCLPVERSALLDLRKGFSSSRLESWIPNTNCCRWEGVLCESGSGNVVVLDLSYQRISGMIDSSLFNLTSLRVLNLAYNLFDESPIPSFGWERLENLTHLNLSNTGFVGQVPVSIARLKNLVSLDLSSFYGSAGLSPSLEIRRQDLEPLLEGLAGLTALYLDGVNISAAGEQWCGALAKFLPKLEQLSLVACSLSGGIGFSLSKLKSLTLIRLEHNNLNSNVPDFFVNFTSLSELRLGYCGLEGLFPQDIFQIGNLTVVDVSYNPMLSGTLPDFTKNSVLESLMLTHTNFSGNLPETIGNLKNLKTVDLSTCDFSGKIPSSIWNLTELINLDFSNNGFSGPIPSFQPSSSAAETARKQNQTPGSVPIKLTRLDLHNNSLSGPIPDVLFNLPLLRSLLLGQNQLFGQIPEFSDSSLLNDVDLSNNQLQGRIPGSLFQLSGLRFLSLASNDFSDLFLLDSIMFLKNLSNIDLSHSGLSCVETNGISSFSSFPKISSLRLVACNLTKIPFFLKYQDQMSTLDLSINNISGEIPFWIWNVGNGSLNNLNLSFNLFAHVEGPSFDPSTASSMILDLHSNKLRGPIPLPPPRTILLDYSDNQFSSSIPSNFSLYLNFTLFLSLAKNIISPAKSRLRSAMLPTSSSLTSPTTA
ncbi:hypothetical protein KSP40_PGU007106 [Platanthera guangdongensis]|uniref:Leucine-rich repeat-containing N-terminal plant-type domain-containing protein n=1 Tax=Platanthera guangdongensis TaxID=2320717 RepID=A0ABR2M7C9_9ASPA